ncbi:hypothetical protein [Nocardia asiatica]|uniref:hypothetical protein n=1 Tax=Nocardia asiatica TaxID=209252 RepID=UPI002454F7DB|nr:hypothetical protein [Nocardia asiatica]
MDPVTQLVLDEWDKSGMTRRSLARAVYGDAEDRSMSALRRRLDCVLNGKDGVEMLQKFVEVLKIQPDEVLRALLPGQSQADSLIVENRELNMKLKAMQEHLASTSGAAELAVVRDITASGRWTVGVLPYLIGPTDDVQVVSGTRLAVTLARPEMLAAGTTVREMFINEFGKQLGDRTIFLAPTVRPLAQPAVPADPDQIVHLSIPGFSRDRSPSVAPVDLPAIGKSIAFTATLQGAWCANVAAIVGRALGWGVENTSSVRRIATPVLDGDRDTFVDGMNKLRNDGLRSMLLTPPANTVLHHTGHPVLDTDGTQLEGHAVVDLLAAGYEVPFLVVLRESDRMIEHQQYKVRRFADGTPRRPNTSWRAWRDELVDAVAPLERSRRAMIVELDFPWEPQDDIDSAPADETLANQLLWQRSTGASWKIIRRLLEWGGSGLRRLPTNLDPEAERLLSTQGLY